MSRRKFWIVCSLLSLLVGPACANIFWSVEDVSGPKGRGFNLQTAKLSAKDVVDMARLGARVGRVHVEVEKCIACSGYEVKRGDLQHLSKFISYAKDAGVGVIVVLDPIPKGRKADFWDDERAKESLVRIWRDLARTYAANTTVVAYDLLNEPDPDGGPSGNRIWMPLAQKMIDAIRTEDRNHVIIFEPAPFGAAFGFDGVVPFKDSSIVYSFHFYEPHRLTHQGLLGFPVGVSYPGLVGLRGYWDKGKLSEYMEPARKFQRRYKVPLHVGEFSFIRWAPGDSRYQYLKDAVDLFEKEGWAWLYHSFREWDGWDLELPSGNKNARSRIETTPELSLIQKHLK